jgi:ketosteroid isomerase-like protein
MRSDAGQRRLHVEVARTRKEAPPTAASSASPTRQGGHTVPQDNEESIRRVYQLAEVKDVAGFVGAFTDDGVFTDQSIQVSYVGPDEIGLTVDVYAKAFPDMHRELYQFYSTGDIVVVQLAFQGTHLGPLKLPQGTIPATGKRMDAPCCDVFELQDGKIKRFDCYPSGTVILGQLGVLDNLESHLEH